MLSLEAAIVLPLSFVITIGLITSTAKLYEQTKNECRQESLSAITRRDNKQVWSYNIIEDENNSIIRKTFSLNPVKLINSINVANDTIGILNSKTGKEIAEELKGIFNYEK